jgi:alpha-1,2-mannosyltransferase
MTGIFMDGMRSGAWATAERVRGYSLVMLVFFGLAIVGWTALSDGLNDIKGKPLGTDFSNVYAAGVLAREGRAGAAYDPAQQHAAEKKVFGQETPFFGWHYPPFFLVPAAALATIPYGWALIAWILLTLPAYLAALYAIMPRPATLLAAAAFPAVIVNIGHGQNGFLTAALLGGALVLLDRRPAVAGMLIGLLAYKPQFGVLIPLVLLVTWRWTVIAAACATVAALVAVSWLLFGAEVFTAFAGSAEFSRKIVLEQGATGWEKIQSIFSAVRNLGGPIGVAYAAQGVLMLALATSLVWLWRSQAAYELKAAALALACLLATPYVLDYDLTVLAVAIAFLARLGFERGFHSYEISLLAAAWFMPLLARTIMGVTGVPVGLVVLLMLYVMVVRHAVNEQETAQGALEESRLASS